MSDAKTEAAEILIGELTDNVQLAKERATRKGPWDWPAYERERARLSRIAIRAIRAALAVKP